MDIGSPKEDALRRDLTINSLFYNIRCVQACVREKRACGWLGV